MATRITWRGLPRRPHRNSALGAIVAFSSLSPKRAGVHQANPKGLDLGLATDCPDHAFFRSGGKFASLAAGHRADDRVGPERRHADRRSTSTLTASSCVGNYPPRSRREQGHDEACPSTRCQAPGEATMSTISRSRTSGAPCGCDNFLYGFKGAPSARHAYGRNRPRELARATGGQYGGRVTGDKRQGSPGARRCWAAAFVAPFGRKPYGATSCQARLPRHRPQPVAAVTPRCRANTSRARPSRSRQVRRSPCERSQPPGQNAAHCPGRPLHPQGHPKILSNRSQKPLRRKHLRDPPLRAEPLPTRRA